MCPARYGEPRIAPSDSACVQKSKRGNAPWFLFIVPSITPRPERPAPPPAARFFVFRSIRTLPRMIATGRLIPLEVS
jgi:hypothetical protein